MKKITNSVYDVQGLNSLYKPKENNTFLGLESSEEQDFLYSRVAHEHAIFKRHVTNILKIVGPLVAHVCYMQDSFFREHSLFVRIPWAFVTGYLGGVVISEILCTNYKMLNLAAGLYISNKYDAYGHSDLLSDKKPYLGEPTRRFHFLIYFVCFVLLVKYMIQP